MEETYNGYETISNGRNVRTCNLVYPHETYYYIIWMRYMWYINLKWLSLKLLTLYRVHSRKQVEYCDLHMKERKQPAWTIVVMDIIRKGSIIVSYRIFTSQLQSIPIYMVYSVMFVYSNSITITMHIIEFLHASIHHHYRDSLA